MFLLSLKLLCLLHHDTIDIRSEDTNMAIYIEDISQNDIIFVGPRLQDIGCMCMQSINLIWPSMVKES